MCSRLVPFCPVRTERALQSQVGVRGLRSRGPFPVTSPGLRRCPLLRMSLPARAGRPEGPWKALHASASGADPSRARRGRVWLPHVGRESRAAQSILAPAPRRYPAPDQGSRSRRGARSGREEGRRERPARRAASGRTMWRRRRLMGARHHGGAQ